MEQGVAEALAAWVTEAGLKGMAEPLLLQGFCERALALGLPLARATMLVDTLHPVYEGRVFRWYRDPTDTSLLVEYERPTAEDDPTLVKWRESPFYHLIQTGDASLRRCLARGESADFAIIAEHAAQGQTDYLALLHRFGGEGVIGDMDGIYSSWSTDAPEGFGDAEVAVLSRAAASLSLAVKSASLARIAGTLVEVYLGRDAGRRVLAGRIARGVADRIATVLWYSDLRGYTRITDNAAPEQIIPLLNDYAEATISSIHEVGGDVLKLIGDGTLAVFRAEDAGEGCRQALKAAKLAGKRFKALNERRAAADLPWTQAYLGLHVGEVLYGNIGSPDRLDFTVVGPCVNEVARIAAMCRSVERDVLLSQAFADAALPEHRAKLVSVGRYALRGVGQPQELFTLEPDFVPR
ncbi:MAG: adenylate/guanylate cyclase domain-containing protein [Geminicoccaceae bacterium]